MLITRPDYPAMRGNLEPKVLKPVASSITKFLETIFESSNKKNDPVDIRSIHTNNAQGIVTLCLQLRTGQA
jgi:hypothetical protein